MRILFIHLSVLFLLILNACDSSSNDQVSEITIGLAAPLTGSTARVGQDMRVAAEMTVALANEDLPEGHPPFRLSVEDTRSTTEGAEDGVPQPDLKWHRLYRGPLYLDQYPSYYSDY